MTVRFTGDGAEPDSVLGVTERLYEEAVIELERTMNALKAGDFRAPAYPGLAYVVIEDLELYACPLR